MTLKWFSSYTPVDEEFGNVSLLLHGDGTNGSTTIVDSSSSPKAVTVVGNAQISTAQSKFGGSSIAFDGAGDYLETPHSNAYNFGSGDFTIEFWLWTGQTSSGAVAGHRTGAGAANTNWLLTAWPMADKISLYLSDGTTYPVYDLASTSSINNSQWRHIAASRSGSTIRLFVDGVVENTATWAGSISSTPRVLRIGEDNDNSFLNGYIDDFRITKGVARYTENFTPPTAPFSDLSPSGRITIEDNSLDVDARQYIINVEEQDGQSLESGVRTAINDFVVGCKADGIWDAIKASCILAGARTLDGALVPLVGGAPTNYNFVFGDYDRETGLVGNGSTKYLDSNRNNNADPQDSHHLSAFVTTANTAGTAALIATVGSSGASQIFTDTPLAPNQTYFRSRSAILYGSAGSSRSTGFHGISRSSQASVTGRVNLITTLFSYSSTTPLSQNIGVFSNGAGASYTNARIAFYSIGENLDLALLDTRVSNLITAIGGAI